MKTPILLFFLSGLFMSAAVAQQDGDKLFDPAFIHEIRFESPDDHFFDLLVSLWSSPIEKQYAQGNVRIDGILVDSVGVRIKGELSSFSNKRPLKIDFNKYVSGQKLDGIKKLNLNNGYLDPAMQRDALGYHLFRQAGIPAPRTAYANVYFNDIYHGVYVMIEQVDKTFLDNLFSDDDGTLYSNKQCEIAIDEPGQDQSDHYGEMINIANTLTGDSFVNALEKVLDTDAFLRFFLVENFINAKDNPIDLGCNHYLYHEEKSGLLHWMPWDLNFAFYNGSPYPLLFQGSYNVVYKKMLQTPVYRQRYLALACELLNYLFVSEPLTDFIEQQAQLIRADIEIDPRYPGTVVQFDLDVLALKALVASRRQTFLNDLALEAFPCQDLESPVSFMGLTINELVASSDSSSGIQDPAGNYPDWIELYNNTGSAISLKGFYLSNDRDFHKQWAFPADATIDAQGYLIIWADRDINESGWHSNFNLNKKGGQLYLSFEDLSVIDSLSYGLQSTNIAYARVPNGTGEFQEQAATFGLDNSPESAATQPDLLLNCTIFPNPSTQTIQVLVPGAAGEYRHTLVQLLNPLGQVILEQESQLGRSAFQVQNLPQGIYFVQIAQGDKRLIKPVQIAGQ